MRGICDKCKRESELEEYNRKKLCKHCANEERSFDELIKFCKKNKKAWYQKGFMADVLDFLWHFKLLIFGIIAFVLDFLWHFKLLIFGIIALAVIYYKEGLPYVIGAVLIGLFLTGDGDVSESLKEWRREERHREKMEKLDQIQREIDDLKYRK